LPPLLSNHDRQAFEVFCYSGAPSLNDDLRRLLPFVDVWHDVREVDDDDLAEMVRRDRIDVLVDLNMHVVHNRLAVFARKPAPVQICWLAYPGTTGLAAMDYRITDPHLEPAAGGPHQAGAAVYAERALCLPHTFWCYAPQSAVEPGDLPASRTGRFTFGCLNGHTKLNPEVIAVCARILAQVPATLLLMAPANDMRRRILQMFAAHGVDPGRIAFADSAPRDAYLVMYRGIDLCLDPFPCGGHTTSLDAFWMGVPVVTLRVADKIVGRAAASIAMNLGLPELIASSEDAYVAIAVALAKDLDRLASLRAGMRARMEASPLMDGPAFARAMEALYRRAWHAWCEENRGRSPGHLAQDDLPAVAPQTDH
jgi:predicted O-linked N-acetylglucosamine transferase (SPINDLY family)